MSVRENRVRPNVRVGTRDWPSLVSHHSEIIELPLTSDDQRQFRDREDMSVKAILERYERGARAVLASHDLPTDIKGVAVENPVNPEWVKIQSPIDMVEDGIHSQEWFAAHIFNLVYTVRQYVEKNDAEGAAFQALRLEEKVQLAKFKFGWERDTIRGAKNREKTSEGGRARHQEPSPELIWENWQGQADEIWARHPTLSKKRVSELIAAEIDKTSKYKAKSGTIAKRIRKNLPK